MGAVGFDAIKHLVLCQVERRPPKLDLDVYRSPALSDGTRSQAHLPRANVGTTSASSYMCLMAGSTA